MQDLRATFGATRWRWHCRSSGASAAADGTTIIKIAMPSHRHLYGSGALVPAIALALQSPRQAWVSLLQLCVRARFKNPACRKRYI